LETPILSALALVGLLPIVLRPNAPVACARAQEPAFAVERYDLLLRVDTATKRVTGEATVTIQAGNGPLQSAAFSLNEILGVKSVRRDGKEVKVERGERVAEGRALGVVLDPALEPRQSCKLVFTYEGIGLDPDAKGQDWMGILLVRDDEIRMSHQSQWYPIVARDPQARSKIAAPATLALDLPAGMQSLGPGVLEGVKKQKGREVHTWKSERPVHPSLIAGTYKAQTVKRGKTSVRVLASADHASGAKAWAEEGARALETLQEKLGKLDVASYGMAEMHVRNRDRSYNYEADGFSVYDAVLFDGRAPDAKKIAHEVAHLWWGGAVDASGPGERFLTESMAEHSAWLCVEAQSGADDARAAALAAGKRYAGSPGKEDSLAEADFGSPRYTQVVYAKGAFALRTLRAWLGAAEFDEGVRAYLTAAQSAGGVASLEGFLSAMKAQSGAKVSAWEQDWVRRAGQPEYEVEIVEQTPGTLRGKLVQKGDLYRNPVELELKLVAGKPVVITVEPTALEHAFEASVGGKVESIAIDPRAHVLFARENP
jgi:hypothetical protein